MDAHTSGAIAAELFSRTIHKKGYLATITGELTTLDHTEKLRGFAANLAVFAPHLSLLPAIESHEQPQVAYRQAAALLSRKPYPRTGSHVGLSGPDRLRHTASAQPRHILFNYAEEVFRTAGLGANQIFLDIVVTGSINLIFTLIAIAMAFVDRLGRRPLMLMVASELVCRTCLSALPIIRGRKGPRSSS